MGGAREEMLAVLRLCELGEAACKLLCWSYYVALFGFQGRRMSVRSMRGVRGVDICRLDAVLLESKSGWQRSNVCVEVGFEEKGYTRTTFQLVCQ